MPGRKKNMTITIEQLEQLANLLEASATAKRAKLLRLIGAYARILYTQKPKSFARRAMELADEDGHYDTSFPPAIEWKDRSGPRLMQIVEAVDDQVATTNGFYHDWRYTTTDRGLYVSPSGELYGRALNGGGSLGSFAAHPGSCKVMASVEWDTLETEEICEERLEEAEKKLRDLAFPLVAARMKGATHS
jgi:hypothetical protein